MEPAHEQSAAEVLRRLRGGERLSPSVFRAELVRVPVGERDGWLDRALGLEEIAADGPELPRGCVPYLPCSVEVLLRMIDEAEVTAADVFVDVGAGVGRALAAVHLLTGAAVIGLEIQAALAAAAARLMARLGDARCASIEGDAARLVGQVANGSVFFLYCPFGGERLERMLDALEAVARARPIRLCCVDMPEVARPWLAPVASVRGDLAVYRSVS